MFLGIILLLGGIVLTVFPQFVWLISESWKSENADEPSSLYIWSTRFGGIMCILIGTANIIALLYYK